MCFNSQCTGAIRVFILQLKRTRGQQHSFLATKGFLIQHASSIVALKRCNGFFPIAGNGLIPKHSIACPTQPRNQIKGFLSKVAGSSWLAFTLSFNVKAMQANSHGAVVFQHRLKPATAFCMIAIQLRRLRKKQTGCRFITIQQLICLQAKLAGMEGIAGTKRHQALRQSIIPLVLTATLHEVRNQRW